MPMRWLNLFLLCSVSVPETYILASSSVKNLVGEDEKRLNALVESHKSEYRGVELAGRTLGALGLARSGFGSPTAGFNTVCG